MPEKTKSVWWKEMSVYQIWPRSFCDGNGDGIGDLWGVLQKLDYIKSLGVDAIWFSPLYPSPNADYGYDIADYKSIHPEYGDLELFKRVLDGAHARGMKVILDLVINHSSDEHDWFKKSKESKENNPYRDYYFWRGGRSGGKPPNNWKSVFEGGAWEYDKGLDEYYLHIFAKKQPDLNMANPRVREEVKDIMRFWLDMGVDGFREDVITYIAKTEGLPNGFPLPIGAGLEHYTSKPAVKDYLREFRDEVLSNYDSFTVGEAPMMTPKLAREYITEGPDQLLNMMFHFQHMAADCVLTDWLQTPFRLRKLKKALGVWQRELRGVAWNALYLENHDHPRVIDRYGSVEHRVQSGKMLAAMYILQSGTPFIYQGQEIGMVNNQLESIDQFKDVVTFNNQKLAKKLGLSDEKFLKLANRASRENARTPLQWSAAPGGGFSPEGSGAEPWFPMNKNHREINVEAAEADKNSMLHWYRALLRFRRKNPIVLYGDYQEHCKSSGKLYLYSRAYEGERLLVICCFSGKPQRVKAPAGFDLNQAELLLCNYGKPEAQANEFVARPYECRVYRW